MAQGKIVDWKFDRGFGFVRPKDGGRDVFLHISDIRHEGYEPQVGDEVSYSLKLDDQGRPRAARAVIAGVARPGRSSHKWADLLALLVPAIFFVGLYGMEDYWPVLYIYLVTSIVAFVVYGLDKQSARSGDWRTSEATLHWIGFLGGWPGATLAQLLFRHKTRKPLFQFVFWMIVAVHIGFWAWLQIAGLPLDELFGHMLAIADSILR
ncbi:MAG: cold shock and DUF1294 domain-containing protein [Proteobacteria bacterium]|nr:cold shock and DUF1294 domain-containing protein [Pseudomonadota bacterium]